LRGHGSMEEFSRKGRKQAPEARGEAQKVEPKKPPAGASSNWRRTTQGACRRQSPRIHLRLFHFDFVKLFVWPDQMVAARFLFKGQTVPGLQPLKMASEHRVLLANELELFLDLRQLAPLLKIPYQTFLAKGQQARKDKQDAPRESRQNPTACFPLVSHTLLELPKSPVENGIGTEFFLDAQ